ncbi:hypothetical protein [Streptomyces sp. Rer75]|uniref:hypothetical protein n=1 Tax=Streptomyces sp. Rer75 TaxID=2750011 RepID=UPI0015D01683|nr:hypothetical protein [Streptomyces sp. Rer75]QLH25005.1 hypothetical protein HYQ63_33785 [Streptomyces sp. Rer75]
MTYARNPWRRERAHRKPSGAEDAALADFPVPRDLLRRHDLRKVGDELARRITPEQARHLEAVSEMQNSATVVASVPTDVAHCHPVEAFPQSSTSPSSAAPAGSAAASYPGIRALRLLLSDPALSSLPAVAALLTGGDAALALLRGAERGPQAMRSVREFAKSCIWRDLAMAAGQPNCPYGALALGLLRGDHAALPASVADALNAAWKEMIVSFPELPAEPIGWSALDSLVAPLGNHSPRNGQTGTDPVGEELDEPTPADSPASEPQAPETTGRLLERLAALVGPAALAAERAATALHENRYPLPTDLAMVDEAARLFRTVASELRTDLPPEEWNLAAFHDTWESAERLSETRAELIALTGLTGPAWCESKLEHVRQRARELVEETASTEQPDAADLVALSNFIRQSAADDDGGQAETQRLMPLLSERLPGTWIPLLAVAAMRQLTLPAVRSAQPAESDPPGLSVPDDVRRAHAPITASAGPADTPGSTDQDPIALDTDVHDVGDIESGESEAAPDDIDLLDQDIAAILLADTTTTPESADTAPVDDCQPTGEGPAAQTAPAEKSGGAGSGSGQPTAPHQDQATSGSPDTAALADEPTAQDDAQEPPAERSGVSTPESRTAEDGVALRTSDPSAETTAASDRTNAGPPTPAEPIVGTAQDRSDAAGPEAAALRAGRFALAAWIRRASGDTSAAVQVREAAALASHLNSATGDIAHRCQVLLDGLTPDRFADDRAGAILTWAVAIRVGLIAPSAQITALIRDLSPYAARGRRSVIELSEVLAEAVQQGTFIVPEILGTVRDEAEAEEQRRTAAQQAEEIFHSGPQRKIRYQLATEVWHHLVGAGGVVGALCARVARDDPAELAEVRQEVARLRSTDAVEREIDQATRHVAKGRKRVDYGAREKLRSLIGEAVTVAATWADLTGRLHLKEGYQDSNAWLVRRINELRGNVQRFREPVREDLLRTGSVGGDPLEAAAAEAAQLVLQSAFNLLDGQPQPVTSDIVDVVLRGDLLLLSNLSVRRRSLEPLVPVDATFLPALAELAKTRPDYATAFEARAQYGDHVGTGEIIRVVRVDDPRLAQELRARREHHIKTRREKMRGQLRALSDRIDSGLRNGLLQSNDWSVLTARYRDLDDPDRYDFNRIPEEAAALAADLETHCERARRDLRERLDKATANPHVAEVADRISARIAADDLTTADEFLAQAEAGKELPPDDDDPIGIESFFPAVPDAVSRYLGPAGSQAAGVTDLIIQVRKTLESAHSKVPDQLAGVMAVLGDRGRLSADRLAITRKALGQLRNLTQGHRFGTRADSTHLDNIRQVFNALGVESGTVRPIHDAENGAGRLWIRLSDLRLQGEPVLPQFGSLVSPTGRTLRVLLVWNASEPSQLLDYTRYCPAEETVIVLYLGVLQPQQWRELAQTARRRRSVVAVLDIAALLHLLLRQVPDIGLLTGILAPFTSADPYTPKAAGDVPEEMFFGRGKELDEVLDRHGSCFVYGGRQLGKSALLRAALRRVRATAPNRLVILESIYSVGKQPGSSDQLWNVLWPKLADAGVLSGQPPMRDVGEAVHRGILAWVNAGDSRQLLILLDEADDFLRFDAEERSFANVHIIRKIMEDTGRRAKVVFAGLHSTVRFEKLPNQPLAHFGAPLSIGPLKPRDAYRLLTRPLGALGYTFPDSSVPARVLALANNAPALVQLFATALLERMRSATVAPAAPPSVITRADIDAVWEDRKLMSDFRERFLWTLNLDNRYRVIAYCIARMALNDGAAASATGRELMETCRGRWPEGFSECSGEEFAGLLGECVELGVLGTDGNRFRLRTPNLLRLLGTREQIEEELDQASEHLQLPRRFEGTSYRAPYGGRPSERSPLTTGQIGRLFRPANGCFIVTGSEAVQVSRVPRALEEAHKDGAAVRQVQRVDCSTAELSKALLKPAGVGHRVMVVNLLDAAPEQAREMVALARERVGVPQGTREDDTRAVVLVTGPQQSFLWAGEPGDHTEIVSVHRFDPAGIRLWMWDAELPFQEPRLQAELLQRTGAWPYLVHQVIECYVSREAKDRDDAYARMEAALAQAPEAMLARCGLRANRSLSAAWRQLVALGEKEGQDPDLFCELLPMSEDPDLDPEVLRSDGYGSLRDVVEVLRLLGALVEDASGLLMTEPLLTRLEQACSSTAQPQ